MEDIKRLRVVELLSQTPGCDVLAKGWVRTKRVNKNVSFIALNDGSTINNIQVVCDAAVFSEDLLKDITTGACLAVWGKLTDQQYRWLMEGLTVEQKKVIPQVPGFALKM